MIIKIFGSKSEGKTTIAQLLEQTLRKHNIEVINEDVDESDLSLDERLKILGNALDPMKCTLKTIPLKLESRPQYAQDFDSEQK